MEEEPSNVDRGPVVLGLYKKQAKEIGLFSAVKEKPGFEEEQSLICSVL